MSKITDFFKPLAEATMAHHYPAPPLSEMGKTCNKPKETFAQQAARNHAKDPLNSNYEFSGEEIESYFDKNGHFVNGYTRKRWKYATEATKKRRKLAQFEAVDDSKLTVMVAKSLHFQEIRDLLHGVPVEAPANANEE